MLSYTFINSHSHVSEPGPKDHLVLLLAYHADIANNFCPENFVFITPDALF